LAKGPNFNNQAFLHILAANPPRAGEFLVSLKIEFGALLIATNMRIWMRRTRKPLILLELSELSQYELKPGWWNNTIIVWTRVGETKTFEGVPLALHEDLANYLISGPSATSLSPTDATNNAEEPDSSPFPVGLVGIGAFAIFMVGKIPSMQDFGSALIDLVGGLLLAFASEQASRAVFGARARKRDQESPPSSASTASAAPTDDDNAPAVCPNCNREVRLNAIECHHCHALFGPGSAWKPIRASRRASP
jgi:hypothetical protein